MRRGAPLILLCILGVGCSSGSDSDASAQQQLVAEVASFDLSPKRTERFVVGLFAADRGEVAFGAIDLSFDYLGSMGGPVDGSDSQPLAGSPGPVAADFLSIPGTEELTGDEPTFDPPDGARGVYGTSPIRFPIAGVWEVTVEASVDGNALTTSTVFEVFADSVVPGPGDPAPRSEQPLPGDPSVSPRSIDSRLGFDDELPDPSLHQVTIADALDAERPVMVTVTTPVFCVSRFCGPITDELVRLGTDYGDRVEFVHLEVWEDFENGVLNDAAAEWIAPEGTERAAEPWVFLIDSTGTIVARWDNVASVVELTAALDQVIG